VLTATASREHCAAVPLDELLDETAGAGCRCCCYQHHIRAGWLQQAVCAHATPLPLTFISDWPGAAAA
jgi:hypothetical protein